MKKLIALLLAGFMSLSASTGWALLYHPTYPVYCELPTYHYVVPYYYYPTPVYVYTPQVVTTTTIWPGWTSYW
ncbi:hypothetical protein ACQZV8_14870 [Magnetococcales bacterium HHB-1]